MAKQKSIPEEFKLLIEDLANAIAGPAPAGEEVSSDRR